MKYFYVIFLLIVVNFTHIFSQTAEPSANVEKRIFQIELESLYLIEKENDETLNSWSIPSTLIRYGLTNHIELQASIPFLHERIYVADELISSEQIFDNAQVGFSLNLWQEKSIVPQAALMYRALIPVYNSVESEIGHIVSLNLSNSITDKIALNYNLGTVFSQNSKAGYYIINLAYTITEKVHCFSEIFGEFDANVFFGNCFNFGIGYNLTKTLCLDLSMAKGLDHERTYFGGVLAYSFNI
jgi:hypothetical protein